MPISHDGIITRYNHSRLAADRPLSANIVRNAVAASSHLVDQYAQVRINWSSPTGLTATVGTEPYLMAQHETPWSVRPDGSMYEPVLSLAASSVAGGVNVRFQLVGTSDPTPSAVTLFDGIHSTASTTPVWVGHYHSAALRTPQAIDAVNRRHQLMPAYGVDTEAAVAGVLMLRLDVWLYTDSGSTSAALHGVYLREYGGL
jgi:hypothetical protein